MTDSIDNFNLAQGFRAAATACGLKTSSVMGASSLDLALVVGEGPCAAAGVFTTNRVKAAPVLYDQETLARNAGGIRAIIANAGNANACTGPRGMDDARQMAALTAQALGCRPAEVLVLSTGVIGRPLNMQKLTQGIADGNAYGIRYLRDHVLLDLKVGFDDIVHTIISALRLGNVGSATPDHSRS